MFKFISLDKKIWQWAVVVFLAFTWGSSFILMKKGLEGYDYTQVAAFRLFWAFVFFLPFIISRFKYVKRKHIKSLLIVGFIGNGIPALLFTKAQTQVSSALAGMLNSLTPFFVLIIGLIFYRMNTRWYNILGILTGLIGAAGLVYLSSDGNLHGNFYFALLIVLATLFYGFNTNEIKHNLADLDGVTIAAMGFSVIGPIAGIFLLTDGLAHNTITTNQISSLGYIILLALFSSVIALILFNMFIKHTTALVAASVTYIIPIVSIFWGIADGEKISVMQFSFIGIILTGVWLVNKK